MAESYPTIVCPDCQGGEVWGGHDDVMDCPTCHGYAILWADHTPVDSKPERADPTEYTTEEGEEE